VFSVYIRAQQSCSSLFTRLRIKLVAFAERKTFPKKHKSSLSGAMWTKAVRFLAVLLAALHLIDATTLSTKAWTFDTAVAGSASFARFEFKADVDLLEGDTITCALPGFTFGSSLTSGRLRYNGCGYVAEFDLSHANSGVSTAKLTFTVRTATLVAGTECRIDIASGMTLPNAASAANVAERTVALALAKSADLAATATLSTAIAAVPSMWSDLAMTITTPVAGKATSVATTFKLSSPLGVDDMITLVLPDWTLSGNAAPDTANCGTSTFTTAVANSETSNAAISFTVKTASLSANTACTITTDPATTSSPAIAQTANLPSRKIAATIAASQYADAAATTITSSTATSLHAFTTTSLTVGTPTQGSATTLRIVFTASQALAVGDKVVVTLPY
jgi:hypothetical protein